MPPRYEGKPTPLPCGLGHVRENWAYYDNQPNQLDQFLVNTNMAEADSPVRAEQGTVQILKFPGTVATGDYPKPRPFGLADDPPDLDGYSDHFPIGMLVTEAD